MPQFLRRAATLLVLALLLTLAPQRDLALAAPTILVTNANDSGAGSLRAALTAAVSGDTIGFTNNGALWTIQLATPLPPLDNGNVIVDGGTGHRVVLDGSQITSNNGSANGLTITSSNNTISGLVIVGFFRALGLPPTDGGSGIRIVGASAAAPATGNAIVGNWIGVAANGTTADGNSDYGILLDDHVTNTTIG
ncbi:MAG TPA: hypothetical protein VFX76_00385, partial [Roseiflexaceae bacterium]|nr:hypothetical protein [Roseiflexaceae bacterium]